MDGAAGAPEAPGFYWHGALGPPSAAAAMAHLLAAGLPRVGGWTPAASLQQHSEPAGAVSEPSADAGAPRKVRAAARPCHGRRRGAAARVSACARRGGRIPFGYRIRCVGAPRARPPCPRAPRIARPGGGSCLPAGGPECGVPARFWAALGG